MKRLTLLVAIILLSSFSVAIPTTEAAQITLAWGASPSPGVDGYVLQYWEASAPEIVYYEPTNSITLTATVDIGVGEWRFNVIAWNEAGGSLPSNDVVHTIEGYTPPERTAPAVVVAPEGASNLRKL